MLRLKIYESHIEQNKIRGGSGNTATSNKECFVGLVNATKSSTLDVLGVLYTP